MWNSGSITADILYWHEGMSEWGSLHMLLGQEPAAFTKPGISESSKLIITRKSSATGFMYSVQVIVDGKPVGELKSGATYAFDLLPGSHSVQVAGGGLSREVTITIAKGATVRYQTYFSNWGLLGGGLNLRPE